LDFVGYLLGGHVVVGDRTSVGNVRVGKMKLGDEVKSDEEKKVMGEEEGRLK
jgi:hypothetical protein